MLNRTTESHFAAWPETDVSPDGNAIVLKGKYIFPELPNRVGLIVLPAFIAMFALWFLSAGLFSEHPLVYFIGLPIVWFGLTFALANWLTRLFSRQLSVQISPQAITIDKKVYDRSAPIEFCVEQHHKALEEVNHEQYTGKRTSSTYRRAVEVVMMYGERRITIAALRDKDLAMARALVIRLQNVCATIDEMLASLPGRVAQNASTSKGEFGPAPDVR